MIAAINERKAEELYAEIERNPLFRPPVNEEDRSLSNVPFVFNEDGMDDSAFLHFCDERGPQTLKGHRPVREFRASIYNAMPKTGMDPLSMEKAMLRNMLEKTGKNIEDWIALVKAKNFSKHGEIVNYLKSDFSLTHGYANLIARKSLSNNWR